MEAEGRLAAKSKHAAAVEAALKAAEAALDEQRRGRLAAETQQAALEMQLGQLKVVGEQ